MSRSKLEDALAQALAWTPGMVQPVREFHPLWCCEHEKVMHRHAKEATPPRHWYHAPTARPARCLGCEGGPGGYIAPDPALHEYRKERNWCVDFAWPAQRLIVEVEGGSRNNGRHNRHAGFAADAAKYNELTLRGWTIVRLTSDDFEHGKVTGAALNTIERALKASGA